MEGRSHGTRCDEAASLWPPHGYGYGFAIFTGEADEIPSVGHIGLAPPLESAVEMNPKLGYTVIVLSEVGFNEIEPALITFQKAIRMGYWRG